MMRIVTTVLCVVFLATDLPAEEWSGTVVAISDGDTITVLRDKRPVKVRLWGIDCPESRQPFGSVARRFLGDRAHGRTATVHERDRDRYGRVVALVYVDGANLNRELVAAGLAWVYVRYCREPERAAWTALEAQAREDGVGLWSHPEPVPPWEWRQQRRVASSPPAPVATAAAANTAQHQSDSTPAETLLGNRRSRVVHRSTCSHYPNPRAARVFADATAAFSEGYRPCAHCLPLARASPRAEPTSGTTVLRGIGDDVAYNHESAL